MKKNHQTPIFNFRFLSLILPFGIIILFFIPTKAQINSHHYGVNNNGYDGNSSEMVTCPSIDPNYKYVGVHSNQDPYFRNTLYGIRGARIKSDGSMLTGFFDCIYDATMTPSGPSTNRTNLFPLKIIPYYNNANLEYLIIGYVTYPSYPDIPHPFVVNADIALNAINLRIFSNSGFFTDVDQLSNGDFLFSGAVSNSLTIAASYRKGWLLRTDLSLNKIWERYTHLYSPSSWHQDFDIISDLVLIDDDNAIICGNVSERSGCFVGPLDSVMPRAFIAKVDLSNGSFIWYSARFNGFAARLAVNSSRIALAINGISMPTAIALFDLGGNFISGHTFRANAPITTLLPSSTFNHNGNNYDADIMIDIPFIQNIYFYAGSNDIYISGKFINVDVRYGGSSLGDFDMPFNTEYSGGNFIPFQLQVSDYDFQLGSSNFFTYDTWDNACGSNKYPPFYALSNSLPCPSNYDYLTITLDRSPDANTNALGSAKVWTFNRYFSTYAFSCGIQTQYVAKDALTPLNHLNFNNDDIWGSYNLDYPTSDIDDYINYIHEKSYYYPY